MFRHLDDMVFLIGILEASSIKCISVRGKSAYPFPQTVQDFDLNQRLVVEPLLVTDDFDSDRLARAMISTLENLAKGALTKRVNDFVAVCKVIPGNH